MPLWRRRVEATDTSAMAEPGLLAGGNVVLGCRRGETVEAVLDWLEWHRRFLGADAALIHMAQGAEALGDAVAPVAERMRILLVERGADSDGGEAGFLEVLRHRYLSDARGVVHLSIADLCCRIVLALRSTALWVWTARRCL